MTVPIALIAEYNQPLPKPSAQMSKHIDDLVAQLGVNDWHLRNAAMEELKAAGPVVIDKLRKARPTQSPEGQHRIDTILNSFPVIQQSTTQPTASAPANGHADARRLLDDIESCPFPWPTLQQLSAPRAVAAVNAAGAASGRHIGAGPATRIKRQ